MEAAKIQMLKAIIQKAEAEITESVGPNLTLRVVYTDLPAVEAQITAVWESMCAIWHVTLSDVVDGRNLWENAAKRRIMLWYARRYYPSFSLPSLSRMMKFSNHTSVINSLRDGKRHYDNGDPLYFRFFNPVKHFFYDLG